MKEFNFIDMLCEIIMLCSLLEDKFEKLPDLSPTQVCLFDKRVTAFCISFHGNIFAFGFSIGKILLCDSRCLESKRYFDGDTTDISSLSFSRDTLFIASGSISGKFVIHSITRKTVEFLYEFDSPIAYVQYSPKVSTLILILLEDNTLYLLEQQTLRLIQIAGEYTAATWSNKMGEIYASTPENIIKVFNPLNFNEIQSFDLGPEKCRTISSIVISHNDRFFLCLDKAGIARLVSIESKVTCYTIVDKVLRLKYSVAAFDLKDEYMFLSSKSYSSQSFIACEVMTGMTTHTFFGLSEPVLNIVFHPLQPTIYTICKNSLHKWTSAERLRSFCSIPTNMLIKYNKDNYVKSEEFDLLTEEDVEKQLNDVNKKQIAIVDFMINDDKEFSDDDLFPNQMKILPFEEENE